MFCCDLFSSLTLQSMVGLHKSAAKNNLFACLLVVFADQKRFCRLFSSILCTFQICTPSRKSPYDRPEKSKKKRRVSLSVYKFPVLSVSFSFLLFLFINSETLFALFRFGFFVRRCRKPVHTKHKLAIWNELKNLLYICAQSFTNRSELAFRKSVNETRLCVACLEEHSCFWFCDLTICQAKCYKGTKRVLKMLKEKSSETDWIFEHLLF